MLFEETVDVTEKELEKLESDLNAETISLKNLVLVAFTVFVRSPTIRVILAEPPVMGLI